MQTVGYRLRLLFTLQALRALRCLGLKMNKNFQVLFGYKLLINKLPKDPRYKLCYKRERSELNASKAN